MLKVLFSMWKHYVWLVAGLRKYPYSLAHQGMLVEASLTEIPALS